MKKLIYLYPIILLFLYTSVKASEWQDLLDIRLSKWETYLHIPEKSVHLSSQLNNSNNKIKKSVPIGIDNDPLKVFESLNINGEVVLKITGQIYGVIATRNEYENYHLKCEFKWGEKKWEPRLGKPRDSGILFHSVGNFAAQGAWNQSIECQIMENRTGDLILVNKAEAFSPVIYRKGIKKPLYSPKGKLVNSKFVLRSPNNLHPNREYPNGEWNKVEIYTKDQTSIFLVNDIVSMVVLNATCQLPSESRKPLTRGSIHLQSEGVEVYYRRIKLRNIEKFPDNLQTILHQISNNLIVN